MPVDGQALQHSPRFGGGQLTEISDVAPNDGFHEPLPFGHRCCTPLIERCSESCDVPVGETWHGRLGRRGFPFGLGAAIAEKWILGRHAEILTSPGGDGSPHDRRLPIRHPRRLPAGCDRASREARTVVLSASLRIADISRVLPCHSKAHGHPREVVNRSDITGGETTPWRRYGPEWSFATSRDYSRTEPGEALVPAHAKRSFRDNLALVFRARFPVLYIESFEEPRVLAEIGSIAGDANEMRTVRPVYTWSATRGFVGPGGATHSGTTDPKQAVDWMLQQDGAGVFVMLDLHSHLGDDRRPADPVLIRALRDVAASFQAGVAARVLVIVAPSLKIPSELEKDITLMDFPLPDEREIRAVLDDMIATNTSNNGRIRIEVDSVGRERLAKAALGLTLNEATNAFARAMVDDGVLSNDDVHVIMEEKKQTVRKAGLLEFIDVDLNLDDVGGLQNLKRWLSKRNNSWLAEAAEYGLPAPKGVLMTGIPGCGKSLTAKAIAAAWELPLLRLDIGRVFAGLVGSSEQNMRSAIRTAEAAAPCILWLDEIEKGFSGVSGDGDSGTSSRVFGSFLTWMQEKTAPVFVIATANKVDRLPPEFLRKGRFDEIFFVDLPTRLERRDIWSLHLAKRLRSSKAAGLNVSEGLLDTLAEVTEGYAGAEIEQAVVAALFDAFADRRALTNDDLVRSVRNMVPLSITQGEEIAAVRAWAATRAVAATAADDRSGYEAASIAPTPPTNEGTPPPPAEPLARGGRLVDF